MTDDIKCETAGNYPSNDLTVRTRSMCGHIKDGIAFSFGKQGGWVISFKDIETIYLHAKRRREEEGDAAEEGISTKEKS